LCLIQYYNLLNYLFKKKCKYGNKCYNKNCNNLHPYNDDTKMQEENEIIKSAI